MSSVSPPHPVALPLLNRVSYIVSELFAGDEGPQLGQDVIRCVSIDRDAEVDDNGRPVGSACAVPAAAGLITPDCVDDSLHPG